MGAIHQWDGGKGIHSIRYCWRTSGGDTSCMVIEGNGRGMREVQPHWAHQGNTPPPPAPFLFQSGCCLGHLLLVLLTGT